MMLTISKNSTQLKWNETRGKQFGSNEKGIWNLKNTKLITIGTKQLDMP